MEKDSSFSPKKEKCVNKEQFSRDLPPSHIVFPNAILRKMTNGKMERGGEKGRRQAISTCLRVI